MKLGERLKKIRKDMGLSSKKFGELVGWHASTVNRYENSIVEKPNSDYLLDVSRGSGVPLDWILGNFSEEPTLNELTEAEEFFNSRIVLSEHEKTLIAAYRKIDTVMQAAVFVGEPSEIRTPDTLIKSQKTYEPVMCYFMALCKFSTTTFHNPEKIPFIYRDFLNFIFLMKKVRHYKEDLCGRICI